MDGRPLDTAPTPSDEQNLIGFMDESKARWQELLKETEEDDVARLQHGYWTFAFSIVDAPPCGARWKNRDQRACAIVCSQM